MVTGNSPIVNDIKDNTDITDSIDTIESQLKPLIEGDKRTWSMMYELLDKVEKQGLYKEKYKNFTQWVHHISSEFDIHESLIWKRKRAGKFYAEYSNYLTENSPTEKVKSLSESGISAENLELIKKISGNDMAVAHKLISKANSDGIISRKELTEVWNDVKSRKAEKQTQTDISDSPVPLSDEPITAKENITAKDIVKALNSSEWLKYVLGENEDELCMLNPGPLSETERMQHMPNDVPFYKAFTEFAVYTGSSRNPRRFDVLAIESYSSREPNEIIIHGIEIKVSEADLKNDTKMTEYAKFCDYFWLAVPKELYRTAYDLKMDNWGLLLYDNETGKITPPSDTTIQIRDYKNTYLNGNYSVLRNTILTTAFKKMIV